MDQGTLGVCVFIGRVYRIESDEYFLVRGKYMIMGKVWEMIWRKYLYLKIIASASYFDCENYWVSITIFINYMQTSKSIVLIKLLGNEFNR